MNTLIVYSTKYGFTEKCVEILSKEIKGGTEIVNIAKGNPKDLMRYDVILIGGSVYVGKVKPELTEFCRQNMDLLKTRKIGLFVCGLKESEEAIKQIEGCFSSELVNIAISKGFFGGEVNFQKMNFFERLIIKAIVKVNQDSININEKGINDMAQIINAV